MPAHPLQIAGVAIVGIAAVLAAIDLFKSSQEERQQQQQSYSYHTSSSSPSTSNHQFNKSSSNSNCATNTASPRPLQPHDNEDIDDILDRVSSMNQQNYGESEPVRMKESEPVRMPGSFSPPFARSPSVSTLRRQEWVSRLVEMGFSRIQCIQALEFCGNFEHALEYLLQHGAEESLSSPPPLNEHVQQQEPSLIDQDDKTHFADENKRHPHHHVFGVLEQQKLLDLQHPPLLPSPSATTSFIQPLSRQQERSSDVAVESSNLQPSSLQLSSLQSSSLQLSIPVNSVLSQSPVLESIPSIITSERNQTEMIGSRTESSEKDGEFSEVLLGTDAESTSLSLSEQVHLERTDAESVSLSLSEHDCVVEAMDDRSISEANQDVGAKSDPTESEEDDSWDIISHESLHK